MSDGDVRALLDSVPEADREGLMAEWTAILVRFGTTTRKVVNIGDEDEAE